MYLFVALPPWETTENPDFSRENGVLIAGQDFGVLAGKQFGFGDYEQPTGQRLKLNLT